MECSQIQVPNREYPWMNAGHTAWVVWGTELPPPITGPTVRISRPRLTAAMIRTIENDPGSFTRALGRVDL